MMPASAEKTPATRRGPADTFGLVAVAAGASILVFGLGSWAGTYYSNVRVASIAVATIGLIAWLVVALVRPAHRPSSHLLGAFAAALGAFAIGLLAAQNRRLGIDFVGYAVLLTALYLLLVRLWSSASTARSLHALTVVGCAAGGIVFVVAIVRLWSSLWSTLGTFVVPPLRLSYEGLWLGSPNAFAAFQVLLYCSIVAALLDGTRRGRAVAILLGLLVAVDVVLSASRGAWLGIGLATVVTSIAWWLTSGGRRSSLFGRVSHRARWQVAGLVAVILVAVAGAARLGTALLPRLTDLNGADLRASFIAASVRMFQSAPVTGVGPGGWVPNRIAFTGPSDIDYYIPHAHNLPAQVLAEFGLVGVVAAIVVVGLLVRLVVTALRAPDESVRRLGLAVLFACVYFTGQQLVDEFVHQPAVMFASALPIARLDATLAASRSRADGPAVARRPSALLSAVLLVAVVVAAGAALWPERAAQLEESAVTAADDGRWQDAFQLSSQAAAADPSLPVNQFMRGMSAAEVGDLEAARSAFAASAAADDFPEAWLNLAAVQDRLGDPGVRVSLDRALRIGRQQPQVAVAAADMYRRLGDDEAARDALAAAFELLPSLAADPLWLTSEWRDVAPVAVDQALDQTDRWSALLLALESGRPETARSILGELGQDERPLGEVTVEAWMGDQAAFDRLYAMARAQPLDRTKVAMCRRVARIHDPSGVARGWTCGGGWWYGVYPVASVGAAADAGPIPGPDAYPHALYAYRRPGPHQLLVPWLLQIHATIA